MSIGLLPAKPQYSTAWKCRRRTHKRTSYIRRLQRLVGGMFNCTTGLLILTTEVTLLTSNEETTCI